MIIMAYAWAKNVFSRIMEFLDYLFEDYTEEIELTAASSYRLSMVIALDRYGALSSLDLYGKACEIMEEIDGWHVSEKSHNFHLERMLEGNVITHDDQLHYLNVPSRVVDQANRVMNSINRRVLRKWLSNIPENKDAR